MIRYNWKKIAKDSNNKVSDILLIVWYITYEYPPTSKRDRLFKFYGKDYSGDSFLLNPEFIYKHRKSASDSEWAEYIAVASYRSYNEYLTTNKLTIELAQLPKAVQNIIKMNRLLKVEDDKVYFQYEKSQKEK
jgi:hypothetical protein|tara:strand:- start:660 stop:1058 length:399 start_codon:yes stop_codon:yes gene_type:complete